MAIVTNNIMVYRRMLYFYWMPNRVVQALYTSRAVDVYQTIKDVIRLPVISMVFYLVSAYKGDCAGR